MADVYGLDSRGREWAAQATEIAAEIAEAALEVDRDARFPDEALGLLRERGLMGLCIPEDLGGHDQPLNVFAAVVEELALSCPSIAMVYVMHVTAARTIVESTTLADREAVLRDVSAGKHLTTLAFSERGSRSQFWAPVSQLRPDGANGFVTSAFKSWVTAANHADSYVSSAQKPNAASAIESTLYLARCGTDGIKVVGRFDGLGLRGNDSAPVEITNLKVDEKDLITPQGEGGAAMMETVITWFSIGTAAMAHGLCRSAVDATTKHLTGQGYSVDDRKLRDLPNLRARLAEMNCRTEQSRALLGHTCRALRDPDDQTPLFVLQTRMAALEAAAAVTDLAMKACGGAAFSRHLGIERIFRDARAGWVMAPTVDHLQDFVGRTLTGMPLI